MICQEFDYFAPSTVGDALALLADPEAKILAGGMSLVPMMKLRLAAPAKLVDLRGIASLRSIKRVGQTIEIGAMVTHYEIESAPLVRSACPLMAQSAGAIGDVQIRNAGTIGGSVAHADPAADYPAALQALEARVRLTGPGGDRELRFEEFLVDTFTTALEPGELVTALIVPVEPESSGTHYQKHAQPASGFPMVGVAARVQRADGQISFARIGVTGVSGKGYRARNVEERLVGSQGSEAEIEAAAQLAAEGVEVNADIHASAKYRAHLARVATARAIRSALARAR
ncbi:MAG: xanthine dehydrogenase family protein subunit M [Bryobacterales bacterium]|nr:xanthine dehydrogenase family protein subunit M [Bryobacterales bacterium]